MPSSTMLMLVFAFIWPSMVATLLVGMNADVLLVAVISSTSPSFTSSRSTICGYCTLYWLMVRFWVLL